MPATALEHEFELMPEFETSHETSRDGESESEQFFGALANLAGRGASWLTAAGSPQRKYALWAARQALSRGLPAVGRWVGKVGGNGTATADLGTQAASWLSGLLPQEEGEGEWEFENEINPVRKWYPDAMLEHLGHAAAETESEAEAEALAGAMIPLVTRSAPRAAATIMQAAPGLICGLSGVVRALRQNPRTKSLVRLTPAIVKSTAANIAQKAAAGQAVSPQAAVRTLAVETARVLGSPQKAAQAFRRSQALDRKFHSAAGIGKGCPHCHNCGAKVR